MGKNSASVTGHVKSLCNFEPQIFLGCSFFAYNWKLPAYSGAFLLTVDNFSFFTYNWSFFAYSFSFFAYSWSFFAHSGKVRLIRALRDCKQRSLTVSKKAPTVSKKASPNFWSSRNTFDERMVLHSIVLKTSVAVIVLANFD